MFDIASSEVVIVGMVALLVIPPKDLPKAMRFAGHWIGKVRGVASQFRSGFDSLIRESELAEMEKKWAAENERIMREHPSSPVLLPDNANHEAPAEASGGKDVPVMVEPPAIAHAPATASGDAKALS